ncbi:biotin--[acetyl-CoA-carboxylase] ligase [uncultured Polaribacter sp.]|uniref:biotin--[acetyl-CoA-carboxylase] ligase n=1 Tax=uncultured Polaribacter sp. TaxID=174711 RepID=UPI002607CFE7|nr:biotin--[acetyl-CoA-carboxylase] ligase [uncultured Polaribacter sp.]
MKIIKLNATNSTNSFLKELAQNQTVENYTVVVTDKQLKGRGQQEAVWFSEPYKNLTFSVLVSFDNLDVAQQKYLNFAVSLAILEVLNLKVLKSLRIKWPNDILSGNQKISGILIENILKGSKIKSSVIGIGLNVNQVDFSIKLKNVSSLKLLTDKTFNLDTLLIELVNSLKLYLNRLETKQFDYLEKEYLNCLYKKNTATMFKDSNSVLFMGLIRGISIDGKLQVELEDETIKEFGIKEITFV